MTIAEFRNRLRLMGLTPRQPCYNGGMVHQDRDGQFHNVPDPATLKPEEREAILDLLASIIGANQ